MHSTLLGGSHLFTALPGSEAYFTLVQLLKNVHIERVDFTLVSTTLNLVTDLQLLNISVTTFPCCY